GASDVNQELTRVDSLTPVWQGSQPEFLAPLANTRWVPLRIRGHAVTVPAPQYEQWIVLEQKTRHVTGSAGCNRFTGRYDVGGETLRIGPPPPTPTKWPGPRRGAPRFPVL